MINGTGKTTRPPQPKQGKQQTAPLARREHAKEAILIRDESVRNA